MDSTHYEYFELKRLLKKMIGTKHEAYIRRELAVKKKAWDKVRKK